MITLFYDLNFIKLFCILLLSNEFKSREDLSNNSREDNLLAHTCSKFFRPVLPLIHSLRSLPLSRENEETFSLAFIHQTLL